MKILFWIGRIGVLLIFTAGTLMTFGYHAPFRYFVFSVAIVTGYLLFELAVKKYLNITPNTIKQEVSLSELATVWRNQEELEKLKKELEELKQAIAEGGKEAELEKIPEVKKYFGKIDEEEAEALASKGEAITIERVVDSVEKETKKGEVKIIVASEEKKESKKDKSPQDKKESTETKDLTEKFVSLFPNEKAEAKVLALHLKEEEIKKAIEIYEKIKELNPSLSCIIGAVKGENECRTAYEAKLLQEKGASPKKFLEFVSELVNQEINLEVDGKIFKYVALSYGDCVYVNPILLKKFFKEYSPEKEKIFAYLFKDFLCSTINWKEGFIKRGFCLQLKNKEFRVPFIAIKKNAFNEEFKDLDGIKITI